MSDREELRSRLRRLGHAISLPEHIRERHLIAIAEGLDEPAAGVSWGRGRRTLAAWVAAAVVAIPSVAFASESALPGQALYPVKRAVERVWSVVDPDLPARHRLEELEALSAGAGSGRLDQAVHDAVTAADDLSSADPLKLELEQTIERVAAVSPTTVTTSSQDGTTEDSVKEPWWDAEETGGDLASTTTTTEEDASSGSTTTVAVDSEHDSTGKTTTTTERDGGDESRHEEDDH